MANHGTDPRGGDCIRHVGTQRRGTDLVKGRCEGRPRETDLWRLELDVAVSDLTSQTLRRDEAPCGVGILYRGSHCEGGEVTLQHSMSEEVE